MRLAGWLLVCFRCFCCVHFLLCRMAIGIVRVVAGQVFVVVVKPIPVAVLREAELLGFLPFGLPFSLQLFLGDFGNVLGSFEFF